MTARARLGRTTAFRLATVQLVVFALLTALLIAYVAVRTNALFTRQIDATIEEEVDALADAYQRGGIRQLVLTVDARARRPGASLYLVADNGGRTLVGNVADLPLGVLGLDDGERTLIDYRRLDEPAEDARSYEALVRVYTLAGGFRLLIGRDVGERLEFQAVIRDAALAAVAVMLVTGLVSWFFVGRSALKRVEQMAETARGIMSGDLHRRLTITGSGDEFDNLAGSLNAMLARIEALMTGLKEVSDNIAHDLRTPLTRLRGRLEAALRDPGADREEAMAAALSEADGLIAVFDALLRIARVEAGAPGEASETVDAAAVAAEVGELYEPVVEEAGGTLTVEIDGPQPIRASRALVAQALTNLIDNALKYGAGDDGRPLVVRLSVRRSGDEVRLSVADGGPGIPEADRARAVDRFVRLDESRNKPGSGLGLALVAAVARLHGGRLDLADAGPGLEATLVLPAGIPVDRSADKDGGETSDGSADGRAV